MKLLRYGKKGQERPAILAGDGSVRDLSHVIDDIDGRVFTPETHHLLQALDLESLPLLQGDCRIGPCLSRVGKFICIGLNYFDHAAESGMTIPSEPVVFMKATSSIMGPNDAIELPRGVPEDGLGRLSSA